MTEPCARFRDIPQLTSNGSYRINVPWDSVERTLEQFGEGCGLDLDPDFQRAHVWTRSQQIAYVEFILRGGRTGREVLFNQSGWQSRASTNRGEPLVLVDGKQRLQAVRRFLSNEIPAFGSKFKEYADRLPLLGPDFIFMVNDLPTRAAVLQWYIELNAGGTVHKPKEIEKVRALLAAEPKS